MKKNVVLAYIILFFTVSCSGGGEVSSSINDAKRLKYAELFTITKLDSCVNITLKNPWDTTRILARYNLVHRDSVLPTLLPKGELVRIPVQRVATYVATDVGILNILGVDSCIKAMCEPHFVTIPHIQERVKSNKIIDIGRAARPNIEKVLIASCDLIFTTPYKNVNFGPIEQIGTPLAQCTNYMEQTPLGRSEWIKFYAAFFDLSAKADSIFNDIEKRYIDIKERASKIENKYSLLPEKRYGQTWWVPGGESFAAKIYRDAGAEYIWRDDKSTGSLGLSFEEVLIKASKADFWFIRYYNPQGNLTLNDLKSEQDSYSHFDAFKNRKVYGCNTAINDYYTFAISQPHIELEEIATILYPSHFTGRELKYYKQLK